MSFNGGRVFLRRMPRCSVFMALSQRRLSWQGYCVTKGSIMYDDNVSCSGKMVSAWLVVVWRRIGWLRMLMRKWSVISIESNVFFLRSIFLATNGTKEISITMRHISNQKILTKRCVKHHRCKRGLRTHGISPCIWTWWYLPKGKSPIWVLYILCKRVNLGYLSPLHTKSYALLGSCTNCKRSSNAICIKICV